MQATVPQGFCVTLAAFNQQVKVRETKHVYTPLQFTVIFIAVKMIHSQMKNCYILLIFAQDMKVKYTPVKPQFYYTYIDVGSRRSNVMV